MLKTLTTHIKDLTNLFMKGRYVLFANMTEKVSFFFVFLVIARKYSVDTYGSVVALFALFNILMSFFDFGFNIYFQRAGATAEGDISPDIANGLSVRFLSFFPYLALGYLYFFFTGGRDSTLAYIIGVSLFVIGINNLLTYVLFGKKQFRLAFWLLFISRATLVVGFLILTFTDADIEFTMLNFLFAGVLHFILLIFQLKLSDIFRPHLSLSKEVLKKIFRSSIPLGIGVILGWIYDRTDVLILQKYAGEVSVAIYAVAYSLYKFPQSFANAIFTPLFTTLSKVFSDYGYIRFTDLKRYILFFIVFIASITIVVYFAGGMIINLLYGEKYVGSINYLIPLMIALPFLLFNNVTGITLNSCYREIYSTGSVFIAALLNLTLNFLLIPKYGISGAVISTILTEFTILAIQLIIITKFRLIRL